MDTVFDDTQLRCLIDVRDAYEATLDLWRELDELAGHMKWRTAKGRDYLWHSFGDARPGISLGVRSSETERLYEEHRRDKAAAIEAQRKTGQRIHATRDTDLAWTREEQSEDAILWPALKEFDPLFRVNAERQFRALGRGAREVELLSAPSRLPGLKSEPFRPIPLEEQEWLLLGEPLRHVVSSLDRTVAGVVVPDPRFFALQKAWLSNKPRRDPLKKPKDIKQARLIWSWLNALPLSA